MIPIDTRPRELGGLRKLVAPCLGFVALAFVCSAHAEDYVKSYSITHRADVRVYADDGSVRVITSDTNQVEFQVHSEGFAALQFGGKLHIDSHQNGDQVELTVQVSHGVTIGFDNRSLRIEVHMPRNADLSLDTHDGAVEVDPLEGNITVHTKDGAIKASQLSGRIDLTSGDGSITARALKGESKVHTGDGAIQADDVEGKFEGSSGDGAIEVAGRFDFLDLRSGDGEVSARVARGSKMSSPWNIRTRNGGVNLTLPADFQADLDVRANDGHVSLGLPVTVQGDVSQSRVHGTMNGGGPLITVRSGDGSIRLSGT